MSWKDGAWVQEWPCVCNRGDFIWHAHYIDHSSHRCARGCGCDQYRPDISEKQAARILLGPEMSESEAQNILLGPSDQPVQPDYFRFTRKDLIRRCDWLMDLLRSLKGNCYCEHGIGNPMFPDHTAQCKQLMAVIGERPEQRAGLTELQRINLALDAGFVELVGNHFRTYISGNDASVLFTEGVSVRNVVAFVLANRARFL